jgi:hypothetical protein
MRVVGLSFCSQSLHEGPRRQSVSLSKQDFFFNFFFWEGLLLICEVQTTSVIALSPSFLMPMRLPTWVLSLPLDMPTSQLSNLSIDSISAMTS